MPLYMFGCTVPPVTTTTALLDRVKQVHKLPSDYALAKKLGVTHNAISNYRSGKSSPAPEVSAAIAELLGQPPLEILAMIECEREAGKENPRPWVMDLWNRYCPRLLPAIVAASIATGGVVGRGTQVPFIGHPPMRQSIHYAHWLFRRAKEWFSSAKGTRSLFAPSALRNGFDRWSHPRTCTAP